jgi:hypothetical protein
VTDEPAGKSGGFPGIQQRTELSLEALNDSAARLVDYAAFAMPGHATKPHHVFQGTLTFIEPGSSGSFAEIGTNSATSYSDPGHLPAFSYPFIQSGTHLFPLMRGIIHTTHPDWHYILEPGRVWNEDGDNGYTRAAFPFALQERGANCTHNGVMTFLFKADGAITRVAYQIASETCHYFRFNLWGSLAATYLPQAIPDATKWIADFESEIAARMPTRPIARLASDYPGAGVQTANIGGDQAAAHMSAFGVAVDGIHYVGGCGTRYGTYPYCDVLDLPSYSLAKSVAGAIGLMRMEKKYPGTKNSRAIQSAIRECAGDQWRDVTLINALDMATGNYQSSGFEADESSPETLNNFFLVDTYAAKVAHACSYSRKSPPGTKWVYHTSDSFLLGAALNKAYQDREGTSKDYYRDMLVQELWKPLRLSRTAHGAARTFDSAAFPLTGYGLTFHRDDLIKLAEFLYQSNGRVNGVSVLDQTMLDEAMQRTARHGLDAGSPHNKYFHGFWAWNVASATSGSPICSATRWIPYMSGFGGIGVVMLPGNMVYYFVSDNKEYGFRKTLIELHKIRSLC